MDVTQNESGCRFIITPDLVRLDEYGNFIQDKFMELSKIKKSNLFNIILKSRIDILLYPIIFYYCKLLENPNHELDIYYMHKISIYATVYNIEFDEKTKDSTKFLALIDVILKDIIVAKELEESFYDYIISIFDNRGLLYETMKMLKFE
jgi:hypothetical protein